MEKDYTPGLLTSCAVAFLLMEDRPMSFPLFERNVVDEAVEQFLDKSDETGECEVVEPLSSEELFQMLDEETRQNDPERLLSDSEKKRRQEVRDEEECLKACQELHDHIRERTKLLFGALWKPIVIPASLIAAVLAGLFVKGDIGAALMFAGVSADIAGAIWCLRSSIIRCIPLQREIRTCRGVVQAFREKYDLRVEMLLAQAGLTSEHNRF